MPSRRKRGINAGQRSFSDRRDAPRAALLATAAGLRRAIAALRRLQLARARSDTRDWQVKRRERTRQLIELGGLIAKAELVALTEDDRAVIYGLLVEAAGRLRGEERQQQLLLWRRRGKRAFEAGSPDE